MAIFILLLIVNLISNSANGSPVGLDPNCEVSNSMLFQRQVTSICTSMCAMNNAMGRLSTPETIGQNCVDEVSDIKRRIGTDKAGWILAGCAAGLKDAFIDKLIGTLAPQTFQDFVISCRENLPCRRKLARKLEPFRAKDETGRWKIADDRVDDRIRSMPNEDFFELIYQANTHEEKTREMCWRQLARITRSLGSAFSEANDSFEVRKWRFNELKAFDSGCPESLGMEEPIPTAQAPQIWKALTDVRKVTASALRAQVEAYEDLPNQVAKFIRDQKIAYQCYDQKDQGALICYAAAQILLKPEAIVAGGWAAREMTDLVGRANRTRAFSKSPPILSTQRPLNSLRRHPDKVFGPDEIRIAGREFVSVEAARAYIHSPDYRDGLHSGIIVRDRNGVDSPILVPRIPLNLDDIANEKWAGHRAAIELYKDTHNGKEPTVVGAFECLLGFGGEQIQCVNAAGTYPDGNISVQYSSDVLHAYGFVRNERTLLKTMSAGEDPQLGHMLAKQSSRIFAAIERLYPDAIEETRNFLDRILTRYPGLKQVERNPDLRKLFAFATAQPPSRTTEQIQAYRELMALIQNHREGSLGVVYLNVQRVEQRGTIEDAHKRAKSPGAFHDKPLTRTIIPEDPMSVEAEKMRRIRKYMPFFLEEFLNLP